MNLNPIPKQAREHFNKFLRHQELVTEARLIERIGEGAYGTIYRATENCSGDIIAVKVVRFDTDDEKEKSLEEAKIHITLDHKNIVKLFKYYMKENFLIMHQEYFHGEVLLNFLVRGWVWGQRHCIKKKIKEEMNSAIEYLHRQDLAHGDIHGCNVMVGCNGEVKLIDFGSADYNTIKIARDREKVQQLYRAINAAKKLNIPQPGRGQSSLAGKDV